MSCRKIEEFLQDNPEAELPEELRAHSRSCPDCLLVMRQQHKLETMLRAMPRADLPPYLANSLPVYRTRKSTGNLWPALAPALALGLALVFTILKLNVPPAAVPVTSLAVEAETEPAPTPPLTGKNPNAAQRSDIYPVWPPDGQAIDPEDMTIMVSIYPRRQGAVTILLNGADVTASSTIGQQHISLTPAGLGPGEHQVKVLLQQPDGSVSTVNWSFYLLEELS